MDSTAKKLLNLVPGLTSFANGMLLILLVLLARTYAPQPMPASRYVTVLENCDGAGNAMHGLDQDKDGVTCETPPR